jgi:uncharacterized repeat protein (TIGR03803 family)
MKSAMRRWTILGVLAVAATVGAANAGGVRDRRHPPAFKEAILYRFHGTDGWEPTGRLVADRKGALYGTTFFGTGTACGGDGCGTVFKLSPSASGYTETVLYNFAGADGQGPGGLLLGPHGTLFGVTDEGGTCPGSASGGGTVFALTPSSGGYAERTLWTFGCTSGDGNEPEDLLLGADGALYGTTGYGGIYGQCGPYHLPCGTAYKLTPSGSTYTESILWNFGNGHDGALPSSGLVADAGGALYGTTVIGGSRSGGTVYKLAPAGSGYTESVVHAFVGRDGCKDPYGGVLLDQTGALYGTTSFGGEHERGCVYKLTPSGTRYRATVHSFEPKGPETPDTPLVAGPSGMLYGTSDNGGGHRGLDGQGTVFAVHVTASTLTTELLHRFPARLTSQDGRDPNSIIVDAAGAIYGTTSRGGGNGCYENGCGIVYKLTPL